MSSNNPNKARLGKPIAWTDAELADLSRISEADKKAAARLWENNSLPRYKKLLQAEPLEEGQ